METKLIWFVAVMWVAPTAVFYILGAIYEAITGYTKWEMDKIRGHFLAGTTYYYLVWSRAHFISKFVPEFAKKYFWPVLKATSSIDGGIYSVASWNKNPLWLIWDICLPLLAGYLVLTQTAVIWVWVGVATLIYGLRVFTRIYGWELGLFSINAHDAFDSALATGILVTYLVICYHTSLWLLLPVYGVLLVAVVVKLITTPVKIYK